MEYITGNITPGTEQSNSFRDTSNITNNLSNKLSALNIMPLFYKILSSDISSNMLLYGGYQDTDNNYYGFIAILNSNGEVLDILTEYDSGTKFSYFQCLMYDENNNIYGIDKVGSNYRFIMLNNVAIKTSTGFTCKLRQSYYIPSGANFTPPNNDIKGTSYVKKVNGSATYYIFGSNGTNAQLIKFVINVGSTNEWTYYVGTNLSGYPINFSDFILETENDTIVAHIYYVERDLALYYDYFNGSTLARQYSNSFNMNFIKDIRVLSGTECYVGVEENIDENNYNMNIYLVENDSYTLKQTTIHLLN